MVVLYRHLKWKYPRLCRLLRFLPPIPAADGVLEKNLSQQEAEDVKFYIYLLHNEVVASCKCYFTLIPNTQMIAFLVIHSVQDYRLSL